MIALSVAVAAYLTALAGLIFISGNRRLFCCYTAAKAAVSEGISVKAETKLLSRLSAFTDEMSDAADTLKEVTDKVSAMEDEAAKAHAFHDEVLPAMARLRAAADETEELCDEDYWPLPCYSRLLFYTE